MTVMADTAGQCHALIGWYGRHRRPVARSDWLLWPAPLASGTLLLTDKTANTAGQLSFEEFKLWYSKPSDASLRVAESAFELELLKANGALTYLGGCYGRHRRPVARSPSGCYMRHPRLVLRSN